MKQMIHYFKENKVGSWILLTVLAILIVLPLLPRQIISNYTIHILVVIMLYAYWGSAWNLLSGFAGQLSQGHAAYVGIGAYVAVLLYNDNGISPWIGMFIAGLIAGLFSLLIGYPCFKLRGSYYTLSTVALLYVLRILFSNNQSILGYKINAAIGLKISWNGENFWGMQFRSKAPYYYIILGLLVMCFLLCVYIRHAKTGYYLAAIRTNQDAASSLGVNVHGYKLRIGFVSALLTAMGGAFYAFFLCMADPPTMFNYDVSVRIMLLAVIGGRGTLLGPLLGAFILTPISEVFRAQFGSRISGLSFVIYGVITMLIVLFLPKGLVGLPDIIHDKIAHSKKSRKTEVRL